MDLIDKYLNEATLSPADIDIVMDPLFGAEKSIGQAKGKIMAAGSPKIIIIQLKNAQTHLESAIKFLKKVK